MHKLIVRARRKTASDPVPAVVVATSPALPDTQSPPPTSAKHQSTLAASAKSDALAVCDELERLYEALNHITPDSSPRTFRLAQSGKRKISQKVIEEAGEVALEAVKHRAPGVIRESADLLYHLVVLWHRSGVEPSEIWSEMRTRADAFGIAEKRPKPSAAAQIESLKASDHA